MEAAHIYPTYILIIDYLLGVVMWTLLGRAVLDVFVGPESTMVIAKVFRQITQPAIRLFSKITPAFLVQSLIPVYVAWWLFMVRFYILPLLFVGEVVGVLSFPLESTIGKMFQF